MNCSIDELLKNNSKNKTPGGISASSAERGTDYNDKQNLLMRKIRSSSRDIGDIPKIRNRSRRSRCKNNLAKFLKTYMIETFDKPWSKDHLEVLKKMELAIKHGGNFALAMPRGTGKTSIAGGGVVWGIANGWITMGAVVGADKDSAKNILIGVKLEFEFNEKLKQDFPEICYPIECLEGNNQRAKGQVHNGERTLIKWTDEKLVFPTIKGNKASGSFLGCAGITGSIRGLIHKLETGEILRPNFVMIDDPQTDESARSASQCEIREKGITKLMALAGPGKSISLVMPCTIIERNDVAARFLGKNHPEFMAVIHQMIYKFPTNEALWKKYEEKYFECIQNNDPQFLLATEFYRKNRKAMDEDAVVAWKNRKEPNELSALQHVYNKLFKFGKEVFFCEYQNDPQKAKPSVYEISADLVASRVNGFKRNEVPNDAIRMTMFGDINHIGINWVVMGWSIHGTGYIINYGKFPEGSAKMWNPENPKGLTESQTIAGHIRALVKKLHYQTIFTKRGKQKYIDGYSIDANFMTDTVLRQVEAMKGHFPVLGDRGRGYKKYKTPAPNNSKLIKAGNNQHEEYGVKGFHQIVHNSDYWRMEFQKSFLLAPGTAGSVSIFGEDPKEHHRLAEEICGETLIDYVQGDVDVHYTWAMTPGARNDLLDCGVGCMAAANVVGINFDGGEASWSQRKKKPKKKQARKASKII